MIALQSFPILTWKTKTGQKRIKNYLGNGNYDAFHLDFSDQKKALLKFDEKIKNLDFMVDLAHSDYESLVAGSNDDLVQQYFKTNVAVRALIIKRTSRLMLRQKKGRLIFISSTAALRPNPGQGFYAAAKLAAEALYKNTGLELGSKGITTLSIRPGYIKAGRGLTYLQHHDLKKQIPVNTYLEPCQLVDAIIFFLSPSAGHFNATEITLDGGFSAGKK